MNKIHLITPGRLQSAAYKISRELYEYGFWDDKTAAVEVRLAIYATPYGWQEYGGSGDIVIPAVSLSKIGDLLRHQYTSLADVLRHEYGHAIADTHRFLIRQKRMGFVKAFGAPHGNDRDFEFDERKFVSDYAASCPSEDFAETFMVFLKFGGRLPGWFDTVAIRRKWGFIRRLGKMIEKETP